MIGVEKVLRNTFLLCSNRLVGMTCVTNRVPLARHKDSKGETTVVLPAGKRTVTATNRKKRERVSQKVESRFLIGYNIFLYQEQTNQSDSTYHP
jgi:hypothetical protein